MKYILVIWILLFVGVFAYCIRSEILGQDCQKSCLNIAPSVVGGETEAQLREKIAKGTRIVYQTVEWRKALCLAILIVLFMFLFGIYMRWNMPWKAKTNGMIPRGIDMMIPMLFVFIFLYVAFSFMQERFWMPIALKVRETSDLI